MIYVAIAHEYSAEMEFSMDHVKIDIWTIILSAIEKILVKLMSIGHQRPQPQYNSAWAMVTLLQTNVIVDPIVITQVIWVELLMDFI